MIMGPARDPGNAGDGGRNVAPVPPTDFKNAQSVVVDDQTRACTLSRPTESCGFRKPRRSRLHDHTPLATSRSAQRGHEDLPLDGMRKRREVWRNSDAEMKH
jgi:hypothetical protein